MEFIPIDNNKHILAFEPIYNTDEGQSYYRLHIDNLTKGSTFFKMVFPDNDVRIRYKTIDYREILRFIPEQYKEKYQTGRVEVVTFYESWFETSRGQLLPSYHIPLSYLVKYWLIGKRTDGILVNEKAFSGGSGQNRPVFKSSLPKYVICGSKSEGYVAFLRETGLSASDQIRKFYNYLYTIEISDSNNVIVAFAMLSGEKIKKSAISEWQKQYGGNTSDYDTSGSGDYTPDGGSSSHELEERIKNCFDTDIKINTNIPQGCGSYGSVSFNRDGKYEKNDNYNPQKIGNWGQNSGVVNDGRREYYTLLIIDYFLKKGFTTDMACAIAGNCMKESGRYYGHAQDCASDAGGVSFGLFMFYGGSGSTFDKPKDGTTLSNYKSWCRKNKRSAVNVLSQLDFVWDCVGPNAKSPYTINRGRTCNHGKTGNDGGVNAVFYKKVGINWSLEDLTIAWCIGFECAGTPVFEDRIKFAKWAKDLYNKKQTGGTTSEDCNKTSGVDGTDKPCIVGDSWGVGMSKTFETKYGFISGAVSATFTSASLGGKQQKNAADKQIEKILNNSNPKYIVVHTGLNNVKKNENELKTAYQNVVNSARGHKIFFYPVPKTAVTDINNAQDLQRINNVIKTVCSNNDNAHFCDFGSEIMEQVFNHLICKDCNSGDRGFHLTSNGYAWYADTMMNYLKNNNLI